MNRQFLFYFRQEGKQNQMVTERFFTPKPLDSLHLLNMHFPGPFKQHFQISDIPIKNFQLLFNAQEICIIYTFLYCDNNKISISFHIDIVKSYMKFTFIKNFLFKNLDNKCNYFCSFQFIYVKDFFLSYYFPSIDMASLNNCFLLFVQTRSCGQQQLIFFRTMNHS